jgi:hypothetical protein
MSFWLAVLYNNNDAYLITFTIILKNTFLILFGG